MDANGIMGVKPGRSGRWATQCLHAAHTLEIGVCGFRVSATSGPEPRYVLLDTPVRLAAVH